MSAALLVRLEQLGISVEQDGDRLLLDGPEDVLTDDLIAEIAAAKPVLLTALSTDDRRQPPADVADAPPTQGVETDASLACVFHPDRPVGAGDRIACGECRGKLDMLDDQGRPRLVTTPAIPWRCYACRSTGRTRRATLGDWTCDGCGFIVAGPELTERPWRLVRRYGPFPIPQPAARRVGSGTRISCSLRLLV